MYFQWIILFALAPRAIYGGEVTEDLTDELHATVHSVTDPQAWGKMIESEPFKDNDSQDPVRVIPKKVWRDMRKYLKALPTTNPVSSVVQTVLDIPLPHHDDNEEQHILLLVAVLLLAVLQLIFALLTMPMILHFYSRRVNIGGNCGRKKKEEALV